MLRGVSRDLSVSGIFVHVQSSIPLGRRVELRIDAQNTSEPIITSGIVVHSVAGVGIGVQFSQQVPRTRERIAALLRARG